MTGSSGSGRLSQVIAEPTAIHRKLVVSSNLQVARQPIAAARRRAMIMPRSLRNARDRANFPFKNKRDECVRVVLEP